MEYKQDQSVPAMQQPKTPLPAIGRRLQRLSLRQHAAAVVASIAVLGAINGVLNAMYARSNFPVPYAEGQTSFSADAVKGWYAVMSRASSLDTYVATQLFDFVFIAAIATTATIVGSFVVRLAARSPHAWGRSLGRRLGLAVMWLIPLGCVFDVVENLISFPMLAQPATFWAGLAVAQSTAAVTKFALIASGLAALLAAIVVLVIAWLAPTRRQSDASGPHAPDRDHGASTVSGR